jgi:hypothetical protein
MAWFVKGANMNMHNGLALVSILILILAIAAGPGLVWMLDRWMSGRNDWASH